MGRGQPPAPAIPMTKNQVKVLTEMTRKHTTPQQIAKRIQILLLANKGQSNSQIKREIGISLNTVKAWRRRWLSEYETLVSYEQSMEEQQLNQSDYCKQLLSVVQDLARSGAPKVITLEQEQQIIGLACDQPTNHNLEMTDWTYEMLARVAIAKGIVSTISACQVGRILKKQPAPTA